ncbi:potassium-transporting ATPase subunit F [Staphylococcus argenteus]|nr:potassium transporter TrkA [Staphylococcus argenteus]ATY57546.1 potassium-transporting ATPase subunit F [Staphylococcus argenteus]ATZ87767.1 potassium-transporting ATPase subunit F [Staphylococcus argenteus]KAA0798418.1 potassium-transporting ATPase subunit F [Staphylococcus argenteus]MZG26717.1 potassium-transporting ATPase subunit F [Staphylococcus argenteus]
MLICLILIVITLVMYLFFALIHSEKF